ncbi:N-acetylmuramoyl-L-alanine amidase [Aliiglaciecola sp. M165]|uniref:N-acetylmuramoyl-L-alanine amidase n=1 Tax=Aliiglaciecola sp. M165 TaxID=2593649 RepID=UPI00117D901E|nr:N-acetylmuramoyl-L-alanine amidase [Aliiglaciecola sp. M165]TRY32104.1 N-acetylmuramoyl-L-alanine amidase [Aliiglaciecola sp. M165]
MASEMTITEHKLSGGNAKYQASPNHGGKFNQSRADTIVIHFTAGSSFDSSVNHLCSEKAKASAHLVIGRGGEVTQLVPFDTIAWHAGRSQWKGRSGLNRFSIGIELDNAGELTKNEAGEFSSWFNRVYSASEVHKGVHRNQSKSSFWHAYSQTQIEKTFEICELLCEVYGITEILGHEEIAPSRKTDPGPAFPLEKLRQSVTTDRAEDGADDEFQMQREKTVIASKLNVRSGPGAEFAAISKPLLLGSHVKVIERQGEWSRIEFTQTGWVSGRFLRDKGS